MNAKHTLRAQHTHPSAPASESGALAFQDDSDAVLLSAFLDGELSEAELNDWLSREPNMDDAAMQGQTQQFIGDALRGQPCWVGFSSAPVFLAGVQDRLRHEVSFTSTSTPILPLPTAEVLQVRAPAANDAVFRWKLVSGLASLAAVMAVSWSVLATAPSGAGPGAAAPQLALSPTPPQSPTAARGVAVAASTTVPLVVVNTRQGVLLRDAELEALMAEHRQHGGVSALQMPAGFLRNATYDPDAR